LSATARAGLPGGPRPDDGLPKPAGTSPRTKHSEVLPAANGHRVDAARVGSTPVFGVPPALRAPCAERRRNILPRPCAAPSPPCRYPRGAVPHAHMSLAPERSKPFAARWPERLGLGHREWFSPCGAVVPHDALGDPVPELRGQPCYTDPSRSPCGAHTGTRAQTEWLKPDRRCSKAF
jgi:hypothetical protein